MFLAVYIRFIKNLAYSDIWLHNIKNKNSRAVLAYAWNLRSFSDYIQQLEMESLGKQPSKKSEFKKTGQIIFGGYGPTAQHSYFQLLHQGTQDICADIIICKDNVKSLAYAQATSQARLMSKGAEGLKDYEKININMPINVFNIKSKSSFDLGFLLAGSPSRPSHAAESRARASVNAASLCRTRSVALSKLVCASSNACEEMTLVANSCFARARSASACASIVRCPR